MCSATVQNVVGFFMCKKAAKAVGCVGATMKRHSWDDRITRVWAKFMVSSATAAAADEDMSSDVQACFFCQPWMNALTNILRN